MNNFLTDFGVSGLSGHQTNSNCQFSYFSNDSLKGWFQSPNFPGNYPKDIICHYLFYGVHNETVKLRFIYFDIEGVDLCDPETASDTIEFSNFMTRDRMFRLKCGTVNKIFI